MKPQTGADLLRAVVALVSPPEKTEPPFRPEKVPLVLSVDDLSDIVRARLTDVVPAAPELKPVLDRLVQLTEAPADGELATPLDWILHTSRLVKTNEMLTLTEVPIRDAVAAADPGRWLAGIAATITAEAWRIKGLYADAVVKAWSFGPADAALDKASRAMAAFPDFAARIHTVLETRAHDGSPVYRLNPKGLLGEVSAIGERRQALIDLLGLLGRSTGAYGVLDQQLWDEVRDAPQEAMTWWINSQPSRREHVRELTLKVQRVGAMVTAILVDVEVSTWADQLLLPGGLPNRLRGYDAELQKIMTDLRDAIAHDGGLKQDAGVVALQELVTRAAFVSDRDSAISQLKVQGVILNTIQTALLATLVVGLASLTAGAAAPVAGAAVESFAAGALGVETGAELAAFNAAGAFGARVLVFTAVNRLGNAVVFGESTLKDSSFAEDLVWNALMMGSGELVQAGYSRIFRGLGKTSRAFKVGSFVAGEVHMLSFTEIQHLLQTGEFLNGEGLLRAVLQQAVMTTTMRLGERVAKPFSGRGGALPGMPPEVVTQLDLGAQELAAARKKVRDGAATDVDKEQLPRKVEKQRNDEVAAIAALPDSPQRTAELKTYNDERLDAEREQAQHGMLPTLVGPDGKPSCAAIAPGVVAAEPEAIARAAEVYDKPPASTLTPLGEDGMLKATAPDGQTTILVPAGNVAADPPPPADAAAVPAAIADILAVDELAQDGQGNLDAMFSKKSVDKLRRDVGSQALPRLLQLLSHPFFDSAQGNPKPSKNDLVALSGSDPALEFAGAYGPELALKLKKIFGLGDSVIGQECLDAMMRADDLLKDKTGADRDNLINELAGLDRDNLKKRLGPSKATYKRPPKPTPGQLGYDRTSLQWRYHYELQVKSKKNAGLSDQVIRKRADVAQVLARAARYEYNKLGFADRVRMLDLFDTLCQEAAYPTQAINGKRGSGLAERIFDVDRGARPKLIFYDKKAIGVNRSDAVIPDRSVPLPNGAYDTWEQKSDKIHTSEQTARAAANQYANDAVYVAKHLPPGSMQTLHFFQTPSTTVIRDAMLEIIVQRSEGTISVVIFGEKDVHVLAVTPAPVP